MDKHSKKIHWRFDAVFGLDVLTKPEKYSFCFPFLSCAQCTVSASLESVQNVHHFCSSCAFCTNVFCILDTCQKYFPDLKNEEILICHSKI